MKKFIIISVICLLIAGCVMSRLMTKHRRAAENKKDQNLTYENKEKQNQYENNKKQTKKQKHYIEISTIKINSRIIRIIDPITGDDIPPEFAQFNIIDRGTRVYAILDQEQYQLVQNKSGKETENSDLETNKYNIQF